MSKKKKKFSPTLNQQHIMYYKLLNFKLEKYLLYLNQQHIMY